MRLEKTLTRLPLRPVRTMEPEWLDEPLHEPSALAGNLADLRRINRWLGGLWLTLGALRRLVPDLRPEAPVSFLDIAAGDADLSHLVAFWGRRRDLTIDVTAVDISSDVIGLAKWHAPSLSFAVADARRLPFADASFDVAHCSLALHHMAPGEAVMMLSEMGRVARRGIIVNDLVRGWPGYVGAWVFSRLCTRNPMTRHDAPLSARRAYTRAEMADLAAAAGLGRVAFRGFLGYRVAMTALRG